MSSSIRFPSISRAPLFALAETALVFVVFCLHGAWPVPDVNEAHYLAKAIHFWNPDWGAGDFFFDSEDAHHVFCRGFGWLSLWLSPVTLAWVGRLATWWLLAWAWRRLNWAVLGRPWWSIASGAVMLFLVDHFAMAGEWIVGGVEAKGLAYVLVLLGLEAVVRSRWNRAWLCFGGASMIHVLVGGWAAVAAGLAWLLLGHNNRPTLRSMWPGLLGGFVLSLPGLLPAIQLSWGVDSQIVDRANQIYVFLRLEHHLNPAEFEARHVLRFAVLLFLWLAVRWKTPEGHPVWRLHDFVAGAVAIGMTGVVVCYATAGRLDWAAALLRFYWFRLADVALPIGVALGVPVLIEQARITRPRVARSAAAGLILLAGWQVGSSLAEQALGREIRSTHGPEAVRFEDWREACTWIATSGHILQEARFLTPWRCRTFKWYTGRAEVVNWKDIPQDPRSIVEWRRRREIVHGTGSEDPLRRWFDSLAAQGEDRLLELGRRYGANYVLTVSEPRLDLPVEYENDSFVVYRLSDEPVGHPNGE